MKRLPLIALTTLALVAFICFVSFAQENAEAYLFPQIVGACLLGLSGLLVVQEFLGNSDPAVKSVNMNSMLKLLPMLVLLAGYVYCIEWLGMYSSSALALFFIAFIYHSENSIVKRLVSSLTVALLFTGFIYVIFSVLLRVQAPQGLFI